MSSSESLFGVPFHGEEHDEEEHEGEHEGERIFSNTDSDKFNIKGSVKLDSSLVKNLDFFYQDSDYAHTEQHAEEEHDEEEHDEEEEHHEEGPTTFTNDSSE